MIFIQNSYNSYIYVAVLKYFYLQVYCSLKYEKEKGKKEKAMMIFLIV
jgi:hypothetical protein